MTRPEPASAVIELGEVTRGSRTSSEWPIAAGMLQFTDRARSGVPVAEASAQEWRSLLLPLRYEGFNAVELVNRWVDLVALTGPRSSALRDVCDELGLAVPGYLVAGRPVTDPKLGVENLAYTHASITAAAEFGVPTICLGLHPFSSRRPGAPLWFWTDQSSSYERVRDEYDFVVASMKELSAHAEDVGMNVSLEMYPGAAAGTAADAVRLVNDVDSSTFGINPDLGNLVRVQGPVEEWQEVVVDVLPHANYWHIKNYARAENPLTSTVFTHPAYLELGVVDYRKALRYALAVGFSGSIVVEHYGGDGIAVSAHNRDYLRSLLAAIFEEPLPVNGE